MEKEFVTYKQAVALKELGFDEQCFAAKDINNVVDYGSEMHGFIYNRDCQNTNWVALPLKQQAFKFFRDKYDAHMHPDKLMPGVYIIRYGDWTSITYNTYEEAESACIDKLIELAKQDNDKN